MDVFINAIPAVIDAWGLILQPVVLLYLLGGVVMGLAIGVFPGLGGIAGLSLVLPFMFGLDPVYGLALMIGMVAVVDPDSAVMLQVHLDKLGQKWCRIGEVVPRSEGDAVRYV